MVYVPLLAPVGMVTVALRVAAEAESVTVFGETTHVVFGGPPLHDSDTVPVEPFTAATLRTYVAFRPEMVCDVGVTDKVKSTACTDTPGDVLALKLELPL